MQPHHFLARAQHIAQPVRRPSVVEHGLASLEAGQGVSNQRRVVALGVGHRVLEAEGVDLVRDHGFTTPACVGADQVGLAIAVHIKQRCDFRVFELGQIGDAMGLRCLLVDHVALRRAGGIHAFARKLGIAPGLFVELGVVRVPVVGHKGRIAIGHGHMDQRVIQFFPGLDGVAQFFQRFHDQQGLEIFLGQSAFDWQDGDALARQILTRCSVAEVLAQAPAQRGGCGGGQQQLASELERVVNREARCLRSHCHLCSFPFKSAGLPCPIKKRCPRGGTPLMSCGDQRLAAARASLSH